MATPIDPGKIPYVTCSDGAGNEWGGPVDLAGIRDGALTLASLAAGIRQGGKDVVAAWAKIDAGYVGPGDETVYTAMAPVAPGTDTIATNLETVSSAVTRFADDIEPIILALACIHAEALTLRAKIDSFVPHAVFSDRTTEEQAKGMPGLGEFFDGAGHLIGYQANTWDQDAGLFWANEDLIGRATEQVAKYQQAERDCANKIDAVVGGKQYVAWSATMDQANLPAVYGWADDSLPGAGLPWGDPGQMAVPQGNWVGGIGHFFDALWGAGAGTVAGVFALTGLLGDQAQTQAMLGLYDLLAAVDGSGDAPIIVQDPATGQYTTESRRQYLIDLGKSMIDWDDWSTDPGTAAGEALFNVGTILLPAGLGVAAKFADVARAADIAADATDATRAVTTAADAQRAIDAAQVADAADATHAATVVDGTTTAARTIDVVGDVSDPGRAIDLGTTPHATDPGVHGADSPDPGGSPGNGTGTHGAGWHRRSGHGAYGRRGAIGWIVASPRRDPHDHAAMGDHATNARAGRASGRFGGAAGLADCEGRGLVLSEKPRASTV